MELSDQKSVAVVETPVWSELSLGAAADLVAAMRLVELAFRVFALSAFTEVQDGPSRCCDDW